MKNKININDKTILVTGASGFIGSFLCKRLLKETNSLIIGLDNMNNYYDVKLKEYRLNELNKYEKYKFIKGNLVNKELITNIFNKYKPNIVVNLAAQAGVRYSIDHPDEYIESNIIGFYNILEACKDNPVEHLIFASSSSVYGSSTKAPFNENNKIDKPVSLYAATKASNELLAHAYSKLYNIPTTGLRFFTVYGPSGRPDMAYFDFTNKLVRGEKIKIYNYGNCKRDFTYIDDVIEGIIRVIKGSPVKTNIDAPYSIYNIGNSKPIDLLEFIRILEEKLVKEEVLPKDYDFKSLKELDKMQKGDVDLTYADTSLLKKDYDYKPSTSLEEGLENFVKWYKTYYKN